MCFKKKTKTVKENRKPQVGEGVDDNMRVNHTARGNPSNNKFISGSWKGIDNK